MTRADGAVVHRVVGGHVEERRLQDGGREDDLVADRVVVGVDGLRGHLPVLGIDRLADLAQLELETADRGADDVAEQVVVRISIFE